MHEERGYSLEGYAVYVFLACGQDPWKYIIVISAAKFLVACLVSEILRDKQH